MELISLEGPRWSTSLGRKTDTNDAIPINFRMTFSHAFDFARSDVFMQVPLSFLKNASCMPSTVCYVKVYVFRFVKQALEEVLFALIGSASFRSPSSYVPVSVLEYHC